jgi:hypothetical protein
MKYPSLLKSLAFAACALTLTPDQAKAQAINEDFANVPGLTGSGWAIQNNSQPVGSLSWFQGNNTVFNSFSGVATAYIAANFNSVNSSGPISNWLMTPTRVLKNGDVMSFYTRQVVSTYADRLQVKMSTNGSSTNCGTTAGINDVGDFTTQLFEINAAETGAGYPETWTQYSYTVTGLSNPVQGRFAMRYFVTSGGQFGANSDYIGIDEFVFTPNCAGMSISPSTFTAATVGVAYTQTLTTTNGYNSTYAVTAGALPPGLTLNTNGTLSGTPTATGTYNFTITSSDGSPSTCTTATAYSITVSCAAISIAPSTVPGGTAGVAYSENITQTGSNGTTLNYTVTAGALPAGVTLTTGGLLSGTPTVTGTFNFTVTMTDEYGCVGSQAYTLVINCPTITLTPGVLPTGTATTAYLQVVNNTGGVGTTTYAVTGGALPAGLTLNSNGTISGTPTVTGSFGVQITATDANGCTGSLSYTLVIDCQTITIDQTTLPNAVITTAYSQSLSQTGGYSTESYTITSGNLPNGLTLNTNGTISGTPTATGSYTFEVTITDANGCTGVQTFTIVVDCQAIAIDQTTVPGGTAGTAYTITTLTQTGGAGTGAYTVSSGVLPNGISLSTTGIMSGTPTQTGTFNFDVTFTDDNGCTDVQSFVLTINCQTITIDQTTLPNGTAGVNYGQTITQTGGIGTTTFAITSGTLPAGLTLDPTGAFLNAPTVTGTFTFEVTATDANGCTSNVQSYTVTIGCAAISIDQSILPDATYNNAYLQTLTVTGGVGPITYTVVSGSLPAGITLSSGGVVSGTSTAGPGTYTIDVVATDANGCTNTVQTITLSIGWSLAVKLESFTANSIGNGTATINWKVSGIDGGEQFSVERSLDGKSFQPIAQVHAIKGQSAYSTADDNMAAGNNYYRLATKEQNGSVSYSQVVRVATSGSSLVQDVIMVPTVVSNSAVLQLTAEQNAKAQIRIVDMSGREVFKSSNDLNAGANSISLDLSGLAQGSYLLHIQMENGDVVPVKFVKI